MVKRSIAWTKTADLLFAGTLDYWTKRNKSNSYSKNLVALVAERTKQITSTSFIYKSTDFKDIRIASLGNYSILYKVTEKHNRHRFLGQPTRPKKPFENIKE